MTTKPFVGAGIIVIEKGYALAGLSSKHNFYTGIGGKREGEEEPLQTAMREAVEELFGIEPNPLLIYDLVITFAKHTLLERCGYYMVVMNFDDLAKFAKIVRLYVAESPFYNIFPESAFKFQLDRIPDETAEVTELAFINYHNPQHRVDPDFIKDCLFVETKCLCPLLNPAQPGAI